MARTPPILVRGMIISAAVAVASQGINFASVCANCTAELAALLAAEDVVSAAEDTRDEAAEDYLNCTQDCEDEALVLAIAEDALEDAMESRDLAQIEYDACLMGNPPPPSPSMEQSVLVSLTVEHE